MVYPHVLFGYDPVQQLHIPNFPTYLKNGWNQQPVPEHRSDVGSLRLQQFEDTLPSPYTSWILARRTSKWWQIYELPITAA